MTWNRTPICLKSLKSLTMIILIMSICLSSCVTQRDLEYIKKDDKTPTTYNIPEYSEYHLKPNDAIYIQIKSVDDAASNVFEMDGGIQTNTIDQYGAYLSSYHIEKDGYVELPVIGRIQVMGKTTDEVSDLIRDSVQNMINLPTVMVKLVNQYVSVLGEVSAPGHYIYSQDKLTIFDALGIAGDITSYGDRKHISLIRYENGKNMKYSIDLSDPNILTSSNYYIQPNDFIYVRPIRKRFWGMQEFPATLILSIITTSLVVITFIKG